MKTQSTIILVTAVVLASGLVHGFAQSASINQPPPPPAEPAAQPAAKPAPPPGGTAQWMSEVKNPAPWFSWGSDIRVRNEYYNNIVSLSDSIPGHEQDVVRFRGRLWTSVTPITNVSFNARLAAEPRLWMKPAFASSYRGQSGMEWRYGMVDNLNVKWNRIADGPVSVSAGRQDIVLGDFWNWWLVADGTPLDGSWTYFLDAARVTYDAKEIKTRIDGIYIYQNALPDAWMPTIDNSHGYALTEQNEQGAIVYLSNKSINNMQLDGYVIYKHDEHELRNGDDANIYTVGGKVTGTPARHWTYSVEGAYQFGDKKDPTVGNPVPARQFRGLDAFGANARLSYLLGDRLNNQFSLIYEYLSGDDPSTEGRDEMFDVLWGRWPRWSELYIYSYAMETGGKFAQLNNIQRIGAGWTMNPMKGMTVGAYYNALFAPQDTPTRAVSSSLFSNDGNFRGHFLQAVVNHRFSKNVTGHLWGEFIWQGDYYTSRDLLTFLRAEVMFTF
jgi:hypothetical protein